MVAKRSCLGTKLTCTVTVLAHENSDLVAMQAVFAVPVLTGMSADLTYVFS